MVVITPLAGAAFGRLQPGAGCVIDRVAQIAGLRRRAMKILAQAALPGRHQFERVDERGEQPHIAHHDRRCCDAVMGGRREATGQRLGIRGCGITIAERLDTGLHELACRAPLVAKHRSEITEIRRLCRGARVQVMPRHRNRQVRPQTEVAPGRIGNKIHVSPHIFAREVEERLRRLQNRRRQPRIAGAHVGGDQQVGFGGNVDRRCGAHEGPSVPARLLAWDDAARDENEGARRHLHHCSTVLQVRLFRLLWLFR